MTRSIADLAAEANGLHARVSSISQHNESWQANLVPTRHFQQDRVRQVFGRGATAEAALEEAVKALKAAAPETRAAEVPAMEPASSITPPAAEVAMDDLLG